MSRLAYIFALFLSITNVYLIYGVKNGSDQHEAVVLNQTHQPLTWETQEQDPVAKTDIALHPQFSAFPVNHSSDPEHDLGSPDPEAFPSEVATNIKNNSQSDRGASEGVEGAPVQVTNPTSSSPENSHVSLRPSGLGSDQFSPSNFSYNNSTFQTIPSEILVHDDHLGTNNGNDSGVHISPLEPSEHGNNLGTDFFGNDTAPLYPTHSSNNDDYPQYWPMYPAPDLNMNYFNGYVEYYYQEQTSKLVDLPTIESTTRWGDILLNMTTVMVELCGSFSVCNNTYDKNICGPCEACFCDSDCYERGDCCIDKLMKDVQDQLVIETPAPLDQFRYACYNLFYNNSDFHMYAALVNTCSSDFDDTDVVSRCHSQTLVQDNSHSLAWLLENDWPVKSNVSEIYYRSKFCALCNWEAVSALEPFTFSVECQDYSGSLNTASLETILKDTSERTDCVVTFTPPDAPLFFESDSPKDCSPPKDVYIDTCNATGKRATYDPLLWSGCRAFHGKLTSLNTTYKNLFCALCNHQEKEQIDADCNPKSDVPFPFVLVMSASLLNNVPVAGRCRCRQDEIYDSYERICRPLSCSITRKLDKKRCVPHLESATGVPYYIDLHLQPVVDTSPLVMNNLSSLHDVGMNILHAFQAQVPNIQDYYQVQFFRVIATTFNINSIQGNNRPVEQTTSDNTTDLPVRVEKFRLQMKLLGFTDRDVDITETRLLALTKSIWNFSLDLIDDHEFRASPVHDPTENITAEETYREPALVKTSDIVSEYALDISLSYIDYNPPSYLRVRETLLCAKVSFDMPQDTSTDTIVTYDRDTGSVFHQASGHTVGPEHVEVTATGEIVVCADQIFTILDSALTPAVPEQLFSAALINVSIICQTLSVLGLFLTFLTYCLFSELRTLPGKNTLGLVTSLLLAMLTFEVGVARVEMPMGCVILGVVIHYLLLSSFTWMVVCSLHMYLIFTRLLYTHTHKSGSDTQVFLRYVVIASAVPAVIVACTMLANYLANSDDCILDLGYGVNICYLSNGLSLILASVLPICLAVVVNLALFVVTLRSLHNATLERKFATRHHRQQLIIYVRMSAVTGINWLAGIGAAALDSVVMWYVFIVMCGLQGLYVFAAFVCNERVFKMYRLLLCGDRQGPTTTTRGTTPTTTTTSGTTSGTTNGTTNAMAVATEKGASPCV